MIDLFASDLKRTELLRLSNQQHKKNNKQISINIHRNHAFEPLASIINVFLSQSNLEAKFRIGDYDDSLTFSHFEISDLEVIWLDLSRYKIDPSDHIYTRIQHLKSLTTSPILIILMDLTTSFSLSSLKDLNPILLSSFLDNSDLDDSKSSITGTRLSNKACIKIAQILGLKEFPSLLLPPLKAIVLDLDNTLYDGILGEDGIEALNLTPEHRKLQEKILSYKKQGFLLAISSKNEEEDAKKMFERRTDFPLRWEDFDLKEVNWNPKSQNIQKIAQEFNIGLDSLLFIDDNIAEIESIKPLGIKTILAKSAQKVLMTLELFPQMHKRFTTTEDILRSADIRANQMRQQFANLSQEEYFQNLGITLEFAINKQANIQRITELLNKTNQFISNYTRPTLEKVQQWLDDPHFAVLTISMSDKLSDSGIIAIFIGQKTSNSLLIIDLCISCRALGRKLEQIMFFHSFSLLKKHFDLHSDSIEIRYQIGERNGPFLSLLESIASQLTPPLAYMTQCPVSLDGLIIKEEK